MQQIYTRGFGHYKELHIAVILLGFKSTFIYLTSYFGLTLSHVDNKGADQSAYLASLMRAFIICSMESIKAKLNLAHSKLQASVEQADFSKI